MDERRRGRLVIVVGRDSPLRRAVGHELIERGYPVVMCSGPPGCLLSHEDRCALLDRVDLAILLPTSGDRADGLYLQECARQARQAIFAVEPAFTPPAGSIVVGSTSAASIARAADALARAGV